MVRTHRHACACAVGALTLALGGFAPYAAAQSTASLWGDHGESWDADGRLPDFSAAGYHSRETPIPTPAVVKNVKKDFGAKGDGVADDSDAFIRAIAGTANGALLVPAGRYKITKVLLIDKSNFVLRGEGPDKSVLYMPKSLTDVGADYVELSKSKWPYAGGFVWVEGVQKGQSLTPVTAEASAGDTRISVANASGIQVGQELRLVQRDDAEHSLIETMQGGLSFQSDQVAYLSKELGDVRKVQDWLFKVKSVSGNTITLDRPLRIDVKKKWQPTVYVHNHTVREVGVEGLRFEFSGETKRAHNSEEGYNAIMFRRVTNGWVRNVDIVDADYGVNARGFVYNSQFEDIRMRVAKRSSSVENCHHGLNASVLSQDNLFNRYVFEPGIRCAHDTTVEAYASGNVYANGVHATMRIDHHKAAPYANLFTNLYAENASIMWNSGGAVNRGPQSGVRETFWNITAKNKLQGLPSTSQYPQMTVVGLKGYTSTKTSNRWVEGTADGGVLPLNLYESQVARHLGVYEAETAKVSGAKAINERTMPAPRPGGYTGGGFVDFVNAKGDYVEWTVQVPATGAYTLAFRYANGGTGNRKNSVSVNGQKLSSDVTFSPTGGWDNWKVQSIGASLPTGKVTIRLSATGSSGPDIDSLRVVAN